MPLLQAGCSDPETISELGPRFAFEPPPPGKARIYFYWPASSPAFRGVYQVAAPVLSAQLLPGGYLADSAAPGRVVLQIERAWQLPSNGSAATYGPGLSVEAEAGRVYYLRVVPRLGLVGLLGLERVAAATGEAEIRSCRQMRLMVAPYGGPARSALPPPSDSGD